MRAMWKSLRAGREGQAGVAAVEFALALPLVLGFCLSGLELANCLIQNNKAQRVATMMADLMSQQGQGNIQTTEKQVYDLFASLKVSASPINMTDNGRVVLTVVQGKSTGGGNVQNRIINQQFDGGLTSAPAMLGCHSDTASIATFNPTRDLAVDEIIVHAQVTFTYRPLFFSRVYNMVNLPSTFTRTAAFRARRSDFTILSQATYPMKTNCATRDGLPTTSMT